VELRFYPHACGLYYLVVEVRRPAVSTHRPFLASAGIRSKRSV